MTNDDRKRSEQLAAQDTLAGYDRWAASYDAEPNALMSATAWVLDRAPLGCADCDVLELGCGTGRNAQRVIAEGARSYTGLDGSQGMLAVAAQRYNDPRISFTA
ncbi:MAG TPA: methyltransferase domain-containing protein, partial [Kofleriaceae bacterium]|nr:methyltransferase domain-containing protein [Kofleriaceae bacterium]